jgi:hypothetical protein
LPGRKYVLCLKPLPVTHWKFHSLHCTEGSIF